MVRRNQVPSTQISDRFAQLGMDPEQAAVYVRLFVRGPSRASTMAKDLGTSRPKMYRLLEALIQRGDAVAEASRPIRYRAVAPGHVFARIISDADGVREEAQHARQEVISALDKLGRLANDAPPGGAFRILQGRKDLIRTIDRQVAAAKKEVQVAVLEPDGDVSAGRPREILAALFRHLPRDVPVRVLAAHGSSRMGHDHVENGGQRPQFRGGQDGDSFRFVITDGRECVGALAIGKGASTGDGESYVWTDAPNLVEAHRRLFESLWDSGTEAPVARS